MRRSTIAMLAGVALAGTVMGALMVGPVTAAGETPKAWGAGTEVAEPFSSPTYTNLLKKRITAPADGALMITGVVSAEDNCEAAGLGVIALHLVLDDQAVWSGGDITVEPGVCDGGPISVARQTGKATATGVIDVPIPEDATTVTAVVPVTAGEHTVKMQGMEMAYGSWLTSRGLSIVFVPSGSGPLPWAPPEL